MTFCCPSYDYNAINDADLKWILLDLWYVKPKLTLIVLVIEEVADQLKSTDVINSCS